MIRHTATLLVLLALPRTAAAEERIGPFSVSSEDGRWSLTPGLALQLRYQLDAREVGEEGDTDGFVEARRVRPTLRGALLSKELGYYLHLSTAPGSIELMDAYLDYTLRPWLRARAGQWKIPFTRYRTGSFKDLTLVDWPVVTTYFGAERQMGLALHNGYEKPPAGLQYEAGVFTGVNARASHAVGLSRLFGETPASPSDLADPGPRAGVHPELVAHLAYNLAGIDPSRDTDWEGGPLRLSAGVSAAWDLDPDPQADLALRLAPEVLLKLLRLSLFGAFYVGFVRTGDGVGDQRLGMLGGVFQTSYLFREQLELALRYAIVQNDAGLLQDARDRARALIEAATDLQERSALEKRYAKAGTVQREHETAIGLNVYLIGRSLKLQTDLSWLAHDTAAVRKHDLRFRTQLQLAF